MVWLESHGIQHWEKVQHLGRNNSIHQCRLGADWLGRNSAKRDLGVLVDKWDMNKSVLGWAGVASRSKEVCLPLCSALGDTSRVLGSISGFPVQERMDMLG